MKAEQEDSTVWSMRTAYYVHRHLLIGAKYSPVDLSVLACNRLHISANFPQPAEHRCSVSDRFVMQQLGG